jgi:hypothetical protein
MSVALFYCYAECHCEKCHGEFRYAESQCAECRSAVKNIHFFVADAPPKKLACLCLTYFQPSLIFASEERAYLGVVFYSVTSPYCLW